jgi:transcriptional regulator with XRE-family HTH domain
MSQEALAEAAGLHNNTISKMERGELSPSVDTVVLVCAAMGYEPWQLFLEAGLLAGELDVAALPGNHDVTERPAA